MSSLSFSWVSVFFVNAGFFFVFLLLPGFSIFFFWLLLLCSFFLFVPCFIQSFLFSIFDSLLFLGEGGGIAFFLFSPFFVSLCSFSGFCVCPPSQYALLCWSPFVGICHTPSRPPPFFFWFFLFFPGQKGNAPHRPALKRDTAALLGCKEGVSQKADSSPPWPSLGTPRPSD